MKKTDSEQTRGTLEGHLMSGKGELHKRYKRYQSLEKRYLKRFNHISNLRLFVFLIGAVCTLLGYFLANIVLTACVLSFFLMLFILLVSIHIKVERELNIIRTMLEIQRRYLKRLNGQWVLFEDCGSEFIDSAHPYTYDLDIFGPKSLFQLISVAKTVRGRYHLKTLLANPSKDLNTIKVRQNAVRELSAKLEFCQKLECQGLLAEETVPDTEELVSYAEESQVLIKGTNIIRFLPVLTILAFVLSFLEWGISIKFSIALLSLQALIFLIGSRKFSPDLAKVYSFQKSLGAFRNMFLLIESEQFQDDYLNALRSELNGQDEPASGCLRHLIQISDAINIRYQPILYLILGILLLWDFQCVVYLDRWKIQNGKRLRDWFEVIGAFEALSSLSVILHIHPDWVFPELQDGGMKITARDLGHPLIQQEKCVHNDIEIRNCSCIITGSNMSGKSTFLRAIGMNLVLAYSGTAVCASQFRCSIMDIFTSMVIRDDLINGISTFYAELIRINMILQHSRQGSPMLYLIDEIFRGTNSLDRIAGARVVLRELSKNEGIGLISTHDFELCDLENDPRANFRNYHFEEQYSNGRIEFDYKLRAGRCTTSNAKYLMNMVGIDLDE